MKKYLAVLIFLASLSLSHAGFWDAIGFGTKSTNQTATAATALTGLSQNQMVDGLKEALGKGVQHAIASLGHDGGFLTNLNVKIPLPEKLRSVEKGLRALKQDKLAEDFVATMNHAAEQAVPEAAGVFSGAIKQMSIADAKAILTGTNDSATQFFRKTTQTNLYAKFLPIVKAATDKAGVTSAYKKMLNQLTGSSSLGGLLGGTGLVKPEDFDVDSYVTNKAMDGLFKMVAEEEKRIRENPYARTSDLLKSVFGSVGK